MARKAVVHKDIDLRAGGHVLRGQAGHVQIVPVMEITAERPDCIWCTWSRASG
jgi:hypothetical protein